MNKFHRTMDTPANKKFSRIAVFAAITMLEGALYLAMSVWAILVIKCEFDMTSTNLGTIMYFIYFQNSECGQVVWTKTQPVVAELPNMTFVAERTEGIIICYAALSFLWILTSLLAIVGATRSKLGNASFHCYFTPWAITIMAGCVLDVIATAFHIYDITHTATAESTFHFLGVENIWDILQTVENHYKNFSYPSIIFTCVSIRLGVLAIFNVCGILWSIKQATKLVLNRGDQLMSSVDRNTPQSIAQGKLPATDPNQYYYVPTRVLPETFVQPSSPYRRTFEPLKAPPQNNPQDLYEVVGNNKGRRVKLPRNSSNPENSSGQADVVVMQRRREPQFGDYQPPQKRYSGNGQGRPQMEVPPPVQYERMSAPDRGSYVTEELRGQLPWSYFNAREDITSQRRTLAHVEDHEVLPPVPVPDYTLHFPKKERYTIQDRRAQLQMGSPPSNYQSSVTQR